MNDSNKKDYSDIEYARNIKRERSRIKSELKSGKITIHGVFKDKKSFKLYLANIKVIELLCALPGVGRVKAEKILDSMKINKCKKISGLGKTQKAKFCKFFNIDI